MWLLGGEGAGKRGAGTRARTGIPPGRASCWQAANWPLGEQHARSHVQVIVITAATKHWHKLRAHCGNPPPLFAAAQCLSLQAGRQELDSAPTP